MSVQERTLADRVTLWLATGFGLGRLPVAPGTWGSLLGLAWAWVIGWISFHNPLWVGWLVAEAATLLAIPICGRAARLLGGKDPGSVVLDEIVAVPLVFGCGLIDITPETLLFGFLAFRIMDITKLPPARQVERLPGGWGIVVDDLVAAVYAWLALLLMVWLV